MIARVDLGVPVGVTYFASGTNAGAEILGFADCGINVGVAVHELRAGALEALESLAGSGIKVFADSGAFSEIGFGPSGPFVEAPISPAEWDRRLGVYERLARALGPALHVVAPDMVAFQAETLGRLERYAPRVRAIAELGAIVLVPCQKGALSLADFHARAAAILGIDFVPAIPMKKDATSTADLVAFLAAVRPSRVHLLGLGPRSPRFAEVIAATRAASPATEVLCDSVVITALVGRSNGAGGGPRALTAAQDAALKIVTDRLFAEGVDGLDYTDFAAEPGVWLAPAGLRRFADELGLEGSDRAAAIADLDGWLQADDRYLDPRVELALDALWAEHAHKASTAWRKREAIRAVFGTPEAVDALDSAPSTRSLRETTAENEGDFSPDSENVDQIPIRTPDPEIDTDIGSVVSIFG